jgi:uncharacterized membrane protein YfcA
MSEQEMLLAVLFFMIAALYSSVGHAGASGYIAAMALLSVPAAVIKPTALALNILVASIGLWRFSLARLVPWRLVVPLVIASAPAAYFGASLHLSPTLYQRILAVMLALASLQLLRTAGRALSEELDIPIRPMPWPLALATGAAIGFVAGLSGTGGAIFLTPLLLFAHFATTRIAAGASVVFVLANSITGLSAAVPAAGGWPPALPYWFGAVVLGALVGTQLGRGALPIPELRRALAVVLMIAAGKLAFL